MSVATGCVSNFQDYFVVGAPIVFHGFKAKAVTDSVELVLQRNRCIPYAIRMVLLSCCLPQLQNEIANMLL